MATINPVSQQQEADVLNQQRKQRAAAASQQQAQVTPPGVVPTDPEAQITYFRNVINQNRIAAKSASPVSARRSSSNAFTSRAVRSQQRQQRQKVTQALSDLGTQESAFELEVAKSDSPSAKPEFKAQALAEARNALANKAATAQKNLDYWAKALDNPNLSPGAVSANEANFRRAEAELASYSEQLKGSPDEIIKNYYSGTSQALASSLGQEASDTARQLLAFNQAKRTDPQLQQVIKSLNLPSSVSQQDLARAVQVGSSDFQARIKQPSAAMVWQRNNPSEKIVYGPNGNIVGISSGILQEDIPIGEYVKIFPQNNPLLKQSLNLKTLMSLQKNGMDRLDSNKYLPTRALGSLNLSNVLVNQKSLPGNQTKESWISKVYNFKKDVFPKLYLDTSAGSLEFGISKPPITIIPSKKTVSLKQIQDIAKGKSETTLSAQLEKAIVDLNKKEQSFVNFQKVLDSRWSGNIQNDQFVGSQKDYDQYLKDFSNLDKKYKDYNNARYTYINKSQAISELSGFAYLKEGLKERLYGGAKYLPTNIYQAALVTGAAYGGYQASATVSSALKIPFVNTKNIASFVFSKPITSITNLLYESIPEPTSLPGTYAKAAAFSKALPKFGGTAYLAEAIKHPILTWESVKKQVSTPKGTVELAGFLTGKTVIEKGLELGAKGVGKVTGTYAPVKEVTLKSGETVRVVDVTTPKGAKVRILLQEGANSASQKISVIKQLKIAEELKGNRFFVQVSPQLIPTKGGKFTINVERGFYLSPEALIEGRIIPQALTHYAEVLGTGSRIGLTEYLIRKASGEKIKLASESSGRPGFHIVSQAYPSYPKWVVDSMLGRFTPKINKIISYYADKFDRVNEGKIIDFKGEKWTPDEFVKKIITGSKKKLLRSVTPREIKIAKALIQWSRDTKKGLVGGPELQPGLQPYGPEFQQVEPFGKTFQQISPNFRQKFFKFLGLERGRQFTYVDGIPVEISFIKPEKNTGKAPSTSQIRAITKINNLLTGTRETISSAAERRPTTVRVRPLSLIIPTRSVSNRVEERRISRRFERTPTRRAEQVRTPQRRIDLRNFLTRPPIRETPRQQPRQPPRLPPRTPPRTPPQIIRQPPREPVRQRPKVQNLNRLILGEAKGRKQQRGIKKGRTRYQTLPTLTQQLFGFRGSRPKVVQTGYDIARLVA